MKKKILIGSIIAVVVILLVPLTSVAKSSVENSEHVEITTEFYGLSNPNLHTITMTKKEFKEVELLLKNAQINLGEAESLDEAFEIVNNVILELNEHNMFSKKTDFNLLCDTISKRYTLLQKTMNDFSLEYIDNIACFIIGYSDRTVALNPFIIGCVLGAGFYYFRQIVIGQILDTYVPDFYEWYTNAFEAILSKIFVARIGFWIVLAGLSNFIPVDVSSIIHFGTLKSGYWGFDTNPAKGIMITYGLKGKKGWNGTIWGTAFSFTGIRIQTVDTYVNNFYVGFALGVYIAD
jgi:hypothetical protein